MSNIERIQCGNGNCYLISEENSAILVDTSRIQFKEKILEVCKNKDVKLIVLTHGHIDHIQNAAYLSEALKAPIAMHKSDYELSKNNMLEQLYAHNVLGKLILALSVKSFRQDIIQPFEPEFYLQDGDSLENYGIPVTVIELPGHTKGSIGLMVGESSFIVGDALMNMVYPSKSMLYGNRKIMEESIKKINSIQYDTVYFGHGKPSQKRNW